MHPDKYSPVQPKQPVQKLALVAYLRILVLSQQNTSSMKEQRHDELLNLIKVNLEDSKTTSMTPCICYKFLSKLSDLLRSIRPEQPYSQRISSKVVVPWWSSL